MLEQFTGFKSSNVEALAYEPKSDELFVTFKSGSTYVYEGVGTKRWHELTSAKSIGSFVANKIEGKHKSRKVGIRQK